MSQSMRVTEFKNQDGATLRGVVREGTPSRAVIFSHGLERTSITEQKFKRLADALEQRSVSSFAFDYTGTGLSNGDFNRTTVIRLADDFMRACEVLKKETGISDIAVVGHSISGCVLGVVRKQIPQLLSKIVLLGPALNMHDILYLKCAKKSARKDGFLQPITWQNFREYLSEEVFQAQCQRKDIALAANILGTDFFTENKDADYSHLFTENTHNILHIHGDIDDRVPIESISVPFQNTIIVFGGDHELERPDMISQWLEKSVDFLLA